MAEPFLEERLPVGVRRGASWSDDYSVQITTTAGGKEYRSLVNPFPARRFRISYIKEQSSLYTEFMALYHRAYGRYAGFRVKALDDYSTNGATGTPTAFDQTLALVSAGIYQLQKAYGSGATPLSIGLPVRTLFKPVSGTTKVAVGATEIRSADWTVDTTTGKVSFAANISKAITSISQAAQAVIGLGAHSLVVGHSVHISGVLGMTQINGLRALITAKDATTITVNINSSAFSAWTSGGTVNTNPQSGETVTGGCQFDLPCRFDSPIETTPLSQQFAQTGDIDLIELIAL